MGCRRNRLLTSLNSAFSGGGTAPERSVYVGDSPIDCQAALEAGTHFIAVGGRVDHTHRIKTIKELPATLEELDRKSTLTPQRTKASG